MPPTTPAPRPIPVPVWQRAGYNPREDCSYTPWWRTQTQQATREQLPRPFPIGR